MKRETYDAALHQHFQFYVCITIKIALWRPDRRLRENVTLELTCSKTYDSDGGRSASGRFRRLQPPSLNLPRVLFRPAPAHLVFLLCLVEKWCGSVRASRATL